MIVKGVPLGGVSVPVIVPPGLQLSVYVRSDIGGTCAIQATVTSAGAARTGGVVSTVLVIICVTLILLLQSSVMLNVLVVVSIHPTKDEASLTKATVGTPQLSSASITTAISGTGIAVLHPATLIGAGFEAVGGVISLIVIVCVSVATFPQASVTVHVLVIVAGQAPLIAESDPVTVPPPLQSLV